MVVEYIRYELPAGAREAFLAAWRSAAEELEASGHCLAYEIAQGVEEPDHAVVRIEWSSVEAHEQGFRRSAVFPPFLAKVKPFLGDVREMRHYRVEASGRKASRG